MWGDCGVHNLVEEWKAIKYADLWCLKSGVIFFKKIKWP